jgi:hypothetical protein
MRATAPDQDPRAGRRSVMRWSIMGPWIVSVGRFVALVATAVVAVSPASVAVWLRAELPR